jgi:hypothetical protein
LRFASDRFPVASPAVLPAQIRKLGSTEGFWYDESVLLPASPDDIAKQVSFSNDE